MSELGRLKPPYGGVRECANSDCDRPPLDEDHGAFLHRDLNSDKLVVFCGPCSRHVELVARERFPLVAL